MKEDTKDCLHKRLVKLGDMMGDGLHHEPGGGWIRKEYRETLRALGYPVGAKKKSNRSSEINERMKQRVKEVCCGHCGGKLNQTRSGSKRAVCSDCGSKWQLLK